MSANANKDAAVFSTQRDLFAGESAKYVAHNYLLPKHLSDAHQKGLIHIHDLDYFPLSGMTNCCLIHLEDMLTNGFKMNNVEITTPTNINTAMTLASQIVMAVASSQYGGISFNRLDEVLAPYVTKTLSKQRTEALNEGVKDVDGYANRKTRKDVYDACQTFLYQVNSMTCTSGQSPFISVGFGLGTSWEAKLIQEMILQVQIDGLGKNKVTPVFPKLIYSVRDGINHKPEDPNYDIKQLALECSSKRLYPDILNYDKTVEITGSFKASMSCRSFLSPWYNEKGELQHSGRTNLVVVTLNLVMIGLEANKDFNKFWKLLDERITLAKEMCEYRLEVLSKVQAKSAPILYTEGALMRLQPEDYVLPHLLKRGSSISIGYIGLNELANSMFNNNEHLFNSEEKQKFTLDVLKYIDGKVIQFKEETGVGYSTYATPSESQCKRLRDKCVDKFGIVDGVTDKEYFTNSFHLEAGKQTDPYSRMDFEAQYIPHSNGGFISYSELPDMRRNLEALEDLWDFSYNITPYYAINTPVDQCFECGFEGNMTSTSKGFVCPDCGNSEQDKMYVIRRVSGYLGNPNKRPFNKGKLTECNDRKINE
ncbi:anaerobic ribonucleoside reductase large subunit [Vibrio phage PWH3a-P1]|uniref:anaerobic ribonucleoside reductase large subunit n=1 Tax=Vibrio phage PWH3a-P1 TaxID=754058 RepID=UPI0002C07C97|nr:anaerobic ribonucleoside reductase large subunit [Vibrio phage PWH3a-P1]AGH32032.1 anaerobic ribonucleoside triphosphate reductase [Vibrio phage PWH3a-P1]